LRQVVTVPTRAIQQGLNQTFVYVIKDGIANRTPITRLAQNGEVSAVDGLDAGVAVVVEGQLRLKDGSKVQAADAASTDTPSTDTPSETTPNKATPSEANSNTAMPSSTSTGAGR
jgi:multidrug efflux system membrane fusion protein